MAGEWLKMDCSTPDKPEVFAITVAMGWDDPDLTVGKLFRVWRWFDQQTTDGNAKSVTASLLDRIAGVTGFAQAMRDVGWLVINADGVSLPNFEKHNGATAKSRAQTAKRVATHRSNADVVTAIVTPPLAREEKRREEKIKDKPPKPPRGEPDGFAEFYAAYPKKEGRPLAAKAFAKVSAPLADLMAALEWQCKSHKWLKDGGQFIPLPASWLNGERWKDEKPSMPQPGDAPAWFETRQGVERKAHTLGIGPWVELEEQYPTYRARVMTAAKEQSKSMGMNLDQLAAMAAQRSGVAA